MGYDEGSPDVRCEERAVDGESWRWRYGCWAKELGFGSYDGDCTVLSERDGCVRHGDGAARRECFAGNYKISKGIGCVGGAVYRERWQLRR